MLSAARWTCFRLDSRFNNNREAAMKNDVGTADDRPGAG